MRKCYFALLAFALPFAASAQVSNAENYNAGDQLHYQNCSIPGTGGTGTGQTWNFSSVVNDTIQSTTWVYDDTANPGDIILAPTPNPVGTPVHKTATQNLTLSVNFAVGTIDYSPGLLLADRSFNYGSTDALAFTVGGGLATGNGNVSLDCDGSGTLTTPAGTYPNAYRVLMVHDEVDSVNIITVSTITTHNVSYLWYDNAHTAPLFRIDSTNVGGTGTLAAFSDTSATAQYLQAIFPAAVHNIAAAENAASANINSGNLTVNASLKNGQTYQLAMFNVSGQKVYSNTFTATGLAEHFNLGTELAAGTYFVNIMQKNSKTAPMIIKTVKD